jgi:hypothetical protein
VLSDNAHPGSYTLLLWEADRNALVGWPPHGEPKPSGNFINADDDRYALPPDAAANAGRIVECIATVVVTPPLNDYAVSLRLFQDGGLLGEETHRGTGSDFQVVLADLFVKLAAED